MPDDPAAVRHDDGRVQYGADAMSDKSTIQWTDATWNPVTGCTEVSPGCDHCYARTFAERWRGVPGHHFEQGFDVKIWPDRLEIPLGWKKPRRVFVNSMSDLFHRDIPDDFIREVFFTMMLANQHTYQVLTKRPDRMRRFMRDNSAESIEERGDGFQARLPSDCMAWPAPNIWLGVSIESVDYAWRSDMLRETPAAVRFLSCEPLLGHLPAIALRDMDWVIVGGESGRGNRPMELQWGRDIRDDCKAMSIPFFFKQVGAFRPIDDMIPDDLRIREYPNSVLPETREKGIR
jgi:protein gp37